ncbi:Holliday junction branch migration DNA helicase RuvB [candidate division FCPU426 bacterium]|nr:Holliday junction branch migration DNA helicase RuvB [candidate division FCPU426 bacterium]
MLARTSSEEETGHEASLRPGRLDEFVGQPKTIPALKIFIQAARERQEPLDHVLFLGPPGLGKTTLSMIMAHEMGVHIKVTSGPAIERPGDLAAILTNLQSHDVLFIDEIHRLHRSVEEILYPALEDFALDIMIGKGPSARSIRLDLPRFTLIGATTRAGLITGPLRERFGVCHRLDFYSVADLQTIVMRSASHFKLNLHPLGAMEIARRSRGTPRIANRLLKRVRDFAQVHQEACVDAGVSARALDMMEIDSEGLDQMDRRLLTVIVDHFRGGPVGIDTLAVALGEETETLEDVYEPFLIQIGFLQRTPNGRKITALGCKHIGREAPALEQGKLI